MKEISFAEFIQYLNKIPACLNYHDTLLKQGTQYLNDYRFYKFSNEDLFSISPESNIHIYSENLVLIGQFFNHLNKISLDPKIIFSYFSNDQFISSQFNLRKLKSKPFYYFEKKLSEGINSEFVRKATVDDQEIINRWYYDFNREENTSWDVPNLSLNPNHHLYLMFIDSTFIGAAANTLLSQHRFWIGRLWIEEAYRRKNYGIELMKSLESFAFHENKASSLLVSMENKKAIELYEKLNYQKVSLNCFWY